MLKESITLKETEKTKMNIELKEILTQEKIFEDIIVKKQRRIDNKNEDISNEKNLLNANENYLNNLQKLKDKAEDKMVK